MNLKWAALILAAGLSVAGCGNANTSSSIEQPSPIQLADTPWAAVDAFRHDNPAAQVDSVQRIPQRDGTMHYKFTYTVSGGRSGQAAYGTFGDRFNQ